MPRFEIRDWWGMTWRCDTSDPETAARWLAEMARQYVSVNNALGDIYLRVWPITKNDPETGKPEDDWPVGNMEWSVAPDKFSDKLYEFLMEQEFGVLPDRPRPPA